MNQDMSRKLAIFIGMVEDDKAVTGGERQLQEMIQGLKRNGVHVLLMSTDASVESIANSAQRYASNNVYIVNDYSKRFDLWKKNWILRYKYKFHVCCTVGAFYFDYRTSRLKNAIDYLISYLYLKPSDLLFTTGKAVSRKLQKMGCKKKAIKEVYPAIRESLIAESKNMAKLQADGNAECVGGEKTVLTVGRFHPVKGYDYLLDAVKYCKAMSDIRFVLVGDYERKPDDYYRRIRQRIHEEGMEDQITIYGRTKDDQELASLYRKAWCCMHTSVWESSPITVCEALLFGKPVIATNVGGTAEYLRDGVDSILVPAKDGRALEEAITRLYGDEELYGKLCGNSKQSAEKYVKRTWMDVGEEYFRGIILR